MSGLEVAGAVTTVLTIYAWSRYNKSSKLFAQLLGLLMVGYLVGVSVRWVATKLEKSSILKNSNYTDIQASSCHSPTIVFDYALLKYPTRKMRSLENRHVWFDNSTLMEYEKVERRECYGRCHNDSS